MEGFVKNYLEEKGYGFIKTKSGDEFFFHVSDVSQPDDISKGVWMLFDPTEDEKGKAAKNIKIIHRNKFIKVGERRIKVSNIKEYQKYKAQNKGPFGFGDKQYGIKIITYQQDVVHFTGYESEIDSILNELDQSN